MGCMVRHHEGCLVGVVFKGLEYGTYRESKALALLLGLQTNSQLGIKDLEIKGKS